MSKKSSSNEIKITRVYDAPVRAVWDAWTDPEQTKKWWGPRGFTLSHHSKDLKPGGTWHYTMHGPDGTDYPNLTKYLEVEEHKRLVYDHGGYFDRPPLFRVTVNFSEVKGKTKMEMTMSFATPEVAAELGKFIKKADGYSTWDRLAEYLTKESANKEQFVINHSFPVSIETMFEAWTNPKHLSQWLPPAGASMEFIRADIKSGGSTFYSMTAANNMKMYGTAHYIEITRPNKLVYTQQFTDEAGKISRHPMAPTWPETMLTVVTLTEEGPDQTRVTICWEPYGNATTEEIDTFAKARNSMNQGWSGSFEKLEEFLLKHFLQ